DELLDDSKSVYLHEVSVMGDHTLLALAGGGRSDGPVWDVDLAQHSGHRGPSLRKRQETAEGVLAWHLCALGDDFDDDGGPCGERQRDSDLYLQERQIKRGRQTVKVLQSPPPLAVKRRTRDIWWDPSGRHVVELQHDDRDPEEYRETIVTL